MGNSIEDIKSKTIEGEQGCWIWQNAASTRGYPMVWCKQRKKAVQAHRLAWEVVNGEIPSGAVIRHKCDTPLCVNPDHLEPGTQADNYDDRSLATRLDPFGNELPKGIHYKNGRYYWQTNKQWIPLAKNLQESLTLRQSRTSGDNTNEKQQLR